MKLVALIAFTALLAGCATPHQINLKDGSKIQTMDTPEFEEDSGFYEFETIEGKTKQLNKDEVKSIESIK